MTKKKEKKEKKKKTPIKTSHPLDAVPTPGVPPHYQKRMASKKTGNKT